MSSFKLWLKYSNLAKLESFIKIIIIGPIAVAFVLVLRLLNPVWKIRVGYLLSHRIGHFVINGAEYVLNKKVAKNARSSILVTWNDQGISNIFWKNIVSRNAKISGRWLKHLIIWNKRVPGWQCNVYSEGCKDDEVDPEMNLIRHDLRLKFTDKEMCEGRAYLKHFGWREGEPYVCLQVRDNAYGNKFLNRADLDEHNYRNADINEFFDSVSWLAANDIWILRMGKLVETKIEINKNLKVIDYANDINKSDFLDVWLFANCTGVISTSSGIDNLAHVYRKPTLFVNCLPFNDIPYYSDCIFAPKKLFYLEKNGKKQLNLVDYMHYSFKKDSEYVKNNLAIESLNSSEILECVKEFYFHKLCNQQYSSNQNQLQDRAWFTITASEYFKHNVKAIHPECRIADSLLESLLQ